MSDEIKKEPWNNTPESLKEAGVDVAVAMGWKKPEAKAEPVVEPEPVIEAPAVEPVVVAPVTPAPAPVVPAMTQQEVIKETAKAVVAEMRPTPPPAPVVPAEPVAPAFELSEEDQADYAVLVYLQESNQARFRGVADKFLDYTKKYYAYQDKWAEENPGKEFNAEDDEHSEWFASNALPVKPKDIEDAKIEMAVERKYQEKIAPEIQKRKSDEAFQKEAPAMSARINKQIVEFVKKVNPELAKLLLDDKGNPDLSPANIERLTEADPIAKRVLENVVNGQFAPVLWELEKSVTPDMNYTLNAQSNQIHAQIDRYRELAEKAITAGTPEAKLRDGKQFQTTSQMAQRQAAILNQSVSREQKQQQVNDLYSTFWSLSVDDVAEFMRDELVKNATQTISELDAMAQKKFKVQPSSAPKEQPTPSGQPHTIPVKSPIVPVVASGKLRAPSLSTGGDSLTAPRQASGEKKSFGEIAVAEHFGR